MRFFIISPVITAFLYYAQAPLPPINLQAIPGVKTMAVAHESSSTAQSLGGVTSKSWSHTVSAANGYVRVGIGASPDTWTVSSITYGGTAMSLVGAYSNATLGMKVAIYELVNPATGSQTVSITFSEAVYGACGSSSYTGVDQTTPSDTPVTGNASNQTSVSINVPSASGDMVSDCVKHYHGTDNITVGASQTQRWSGDDGSYNENAAASDEPGAATVTMSWSGADYGAWVIVGANINAASGAAANNPWYYYALQ